MPSTFIVRVKKHQITYALAIAAAVGLLLLPACSRKKDTWTSRTYHNMTSKFNPYFNGEESFKEGALSTQNNHKNNFEEILSVYQWGTEQQATAVAPQMDRAIEKGAKVIQEHSMLIKGKQKNFYTIKSYLLIGKARFYKYEFFQSLETFNYIIQQFNKDEKARDLVYEAYLWAGRCQVMIGNNIGANQYFDELYNNKKVDKNLRADVEASRAQMLINQKNYEEAIEALNAAIKQTSKKVNRIRWTFITAQLYERTESNYEASRAYKKVIDLKPADYEMLFTAQLSRARSFDVYMENPGIVYKELEKMLKDDKNIDFKDQIYYVMAEVALAEEEFAKADGFLKKSVRSSTNNRAQKGLSYQKIADINFDFKDYVPAQIYYDSASTTLPQNHKLFGFANKRKESLKGLVDNIKIINLEDSLQRLASMSESQQRKIFETYIENLKIEEERQKREAELRELNNQLQNQSENMANGPGAGQAQGWYFYNTNLRASGMAAFQNRWGTRKLEDNWRQTNKETRLPDVENPKDSNATATNNEVPSKYRPEYYLAQIPKTEADIDSSNHRIQKALLALGDIYKQQLNDVAQSAKSYNDLIVRFPACRYVPRALYSLYRLYSVDKKEAQADVPKQRLITEFPNSVYTRLILEPDKANPNSETYKKIEALYAGLYKDFKAGKYKSVAKEVETQKAVYAGSTLEPKFMLLSAMCLGKQQKTEQMVAQLQAIVDGFSGTPEQATARQILDLMTDENADAKANNGESGTGNFTYDANAQHRVAFLMPNNGVDINTLRNKISDYNQQYFKLERLQVQNIFFDKDVQIIVVSGFQNAAKARVYYNGINTQKDIMGYLPAGVTNKIVISEANYRDLYRDKNLKQYLNFQKDNYQIE